MGPLKTVGGETMADNEEMANVLNKAFKEVFTREDMSNIPEPEALNLESSLETVKFSEREVRKKIRDLRTDAASGPDGIEPKILQELQETMAPALALVFTKSMEGIVPDDWKEANVTPIFKKGAKSKPENYRPVYVTSVSCKIMESIIQTP